jgi:hypothetical protein
MSMSSNSSSAGGLDVSQSAGMRTDAASRTRATDRSRWTGWIVFAGVLLILGGLLQVLEGFVALFKDDFYVVGSDGLVVGTDYTLWGVVHLLVGTLASLIGIGLLAGNMVARGAAVLLAGFSAIANLLFLTAYPAWSLIVIAFDVVVIYAVVVHGGELERSS